jgi:hypothetical protein
MDNNNIGVLSAAFIDCGSNVTAKALVRGADAALKLARQFDWAGGESRRFSVVVSSRGKKFNLSYLVTFDVKS